MKPRRHRHVVPWQEVFASGLIFIIAALGYVIWSSAPAQTAQGDGYPSSDVAR